MIDSRTSRSPGPRAGAPGEVLDAAVIGEWKTSLSAALESPTSLSDGARVESMRGLEELVCVATAAQAHLARELDASQRAEQAKVGVPSRRRGAGVAGQVALARRESPHRGKQHLGLATTVADELPHTWAAWRAGRITEWKVTRIAQETACLDLELRLAVDELVAGDPDALETMGVQEIAAACMKEAARLDAAAVVKRRRKAESERRVTLRPAPDTMTYVTALLPVKDGVAVHAVLNRAAVEARAVGDERTQGQVMADALVGAVTDGGVEALSSTTGVGSAKPRISLGLVMTDAALFGTSDEPGHIDGFGPVPAELAREIVAGACSREEQI